MAATTDRRGKMATRNTSTTRCAHLATLPPLDPLVWGGWHTHTCIDCHQSYTCDYAHGSHVSMSWAWRCDLCTDQHEAAVERRIAARRTLQESGE